MASLRFTSENGRAESVLPTAERAKISVVLCLTSDSFSGLANALGELTLAEGSELRTDFPNGWTIFWKIREGESRFFVAHPELEEWVATLALSESHLAKIQERLRSGTLGDLSSLERVSRMSNVEVALGSFTGGAAS